MIENTWVSLVLFHPTAHIESSSQSSSLVEANTLTGVEKALASSNPGGSLKKNGCTVIDGKVVFFWGGLGHIPFQKMCVFIGYML